MDSSERERERDRDRDRDSSRDRGDARSGTQDRRSSSPPDSSDESVLVELVDIPLEAIGSNPRSQAVMVAAALHRTLQIPTTGRKVELLPSAECGCVTARYEVSPLFARSKLVSNVKCGGRVFTWINKYRAGVSAIPSTTNPPKASGREQGERRALKRLRGWHCEAAEPRQRCRHTHDIPGTGTGGANMAQDAAPITDVTRPPNTFAGVEVTSKSSSTARVPWLICDEWIFVKMDSPALGSSTVGGDRPLPAVGSKVDVVAFWVADADPSPSRSPTNSERASQSCKWRAIEVQLSCSP